MKMAWSFFQSQPQKCVPVVYSKRGWDNGGGKMVTTLRAAAKDIWAEMSKDYGPMGLPWTKIPAKRRVEFCVKLESKFPVLCLCTDHYKANTVATSNYTCWWTSFLGNHHQHRSTRIC
jgi:hypothetical protein